MKGGWVLYQIFGGRGQHVKNNWTQLDPSFCENEGSKRFKINEKKGVNWIENYGEKIYKMLTICQIIHFGEK